jgi:hypothetical protein
MFTRSADLPEGVTRLPIKTVHLNKSPMVVGNVQHTDARPWRSAGASTWPRQRRTPKWPARCPT